MTPAPEPVPRRPGGPGRRRAFGGARALLTVGLATLAACVEPAADATSSPVGGAGLRVVSLVPSATRLIADLGAADRLVGRTEADTDPELAHLPSVGQVLNPDLERVASLRPDLLVAWRQADTALLRRALPSGARLLTTGPDRLADVVPALRELAVALGPEARFRGETLALRWARELEGAPAEGARDGAGGRVRTLWVVWTDPLTVAGPDTHVDDLMRWAGARNVVASGSGSWPTLSWEAAAALDPEVVVWGDRAGVAEPGGRPGAWHAIRAVAEGRVVVVPADSAHVPGLHSPRLARALARRIARSAKRVP